MHTRMITISRQIGSGGEEIARRVAKQLDFLYLDREVTERAACAAGVDPQAISEAEYIPSLKKRMVTALASNPGLLAFAWFAPGPYLANPLYTSVRYRALIEAVVQELAQEGGAVILGHGAQVILKQRWDTLKVLVSGSDDRRVLRLRAEAKGGDGASEDGARRLMQESDAERHAYFDRVYGVQWLSPKLYDLCLSTDHMTCEEAAGIICNAAARR